MADISVELITEATPLSPLEVLRAKPEILLGVSAGAQDQLEALDINSVFDLASSRRFANAVLLVEAASNPQ